MAATAQVIPFQAEAPPSSPLRVNKRELAARVLGCSIPTIDALLQRYADFPVARRGARGVGWEFDAAEVTAFLNRKRAEEARDEKSRQSLFEQLALPIDQHTPNEDLALLPSQRLAAAKARQIERKLALESGLLIPTTDLRKCLEPALSALGRFLEELPQQLERDLGWSRETTERVRARINDGRVAFVRNVSSLMKSPAPGAQ